MRSAPRSAHHPSVTSDRPCGAGPWRCHKQIRELTPPVIVVDHHKRTARPQHTEDLGKAGVAARREEVCEPRMHNIHAGFGQRDVLCRAPQDSDPRITRNSRRKQRRVRLHAGDRSRVLCVTGQPVSGSTTKIQKITATPRRSGSQGRPKRAFMVDGSVISYTCGSPAWSPARTKSGRSGTRNPLKPSAPADELHRSPEAGLAALARSRIFHADTTGIRQVRTLRPRRGSGCIRRAIRFTGATAIPLPSPSPGLRQSDDPAEQLGSRGA